MVAVRAGRIIGAVIALVLLGAACSGDDDSSAESDGTTTTESVAETTTSTAVPVEGTHVYDLPGDRVHPEGIAYDPTDDRLFVSSSADGTIFQVDRGTGAVSEFLAPGADGRATALGMAVDEEHGRLWIAGGVSAMVFTYDLGSGELLASSAVPDPPAGSIVNDVTIVSNGDAYLTNSGAPLLYKVPAADDQIGDAELWLDYSESEIPSDIPLTLNGIVATPDGHLLAVHMVTQQLFRFETGTREIVEVDTGGDGVGADGLALDGTTLYGVQPDSVVVTELSDDFSSGTVTGQVTDDSFMFATTVALVPGDRMAVPNAQFDAQEAPVLPFTVSELGRAVG